MFSAVLLAIAVVGGVILFGKWIRCGAPNSSAPFAGRPVCSSVLKSSIPGSGRKDSALVSQGLRQFFLAYLMSGKRFVSMPSQIADDLWHEFILYTRDYDRVLPACLWRLSSPHAGGGSRAAPQEQRRPSPRVVVLLQIREYRSGPPDAAAAALRARQQAQDRRTDSSITRNARRCGRMAAAPPIAAGTSASTSVDGSSAGFGDVQRRWAWRSCHGGGHGGGGGDGGGSGDGGEAVVAEDVAVAAGIRALRYSQPRLPDFAHPQRLIDAAHDLFAAPGATVAPDRKQIIGRRRIMPVRDRRCRRHADHGNRAVRAVESGWSNERGHGRAASARRRGA